MQLPIGYRQFHHNVSINYQLNRWLPEAREQDLRQAAESIETLADVKPALLALADRAETDGRWLHAATCYRGAEFFMPFTDPDKLPAYQRYRQMFDRAFNHVEYQRLRLPYARGHLHAMRLASRGDSRGTLLIHGGFDSYMEEFFQWALALSNRGYEVVLLEGPGQGAAIRESGLTMSPEWEAPIAALLDALEIRRCTLIGFSLGGYLALRAAANEPRIERVVLINALLDFLGCFLAAAPGPMNEIIHRALNDGDRDTLNALGTQLRADPNTGWALDHGEHISGSADTFEFIRWTASMSTREFSANVRQPCLVTAGVRDHIVPLDQFFEQLTLLRNSRGLSARLFSVAEDAAAHCQVGNLGLLFGEVERWLCRGTRPRLRNPAPSVEAGAEALLTGGSRLS